MMTSTLKLKTKVLEGNKIEINDPNLKAGETVEVLIILPQEKTDIMTEKKEESDQQMSKAVKAYFSSKEEWKEVDIRLAQS